MESCAGIRIKKYICIPGILFLLISLQCITPLTKQTSAFFVSGTTKPDEEKQVEKHKIGQENEDLFDPRYTAIEEEMEAAGINLSDYRHLGLDKPLLKDRAARQKILDMFRQYVQQNPTRSETYMAQYYIALLLDDEVKQDKMLTQLEMGSGHGRWQAVEQYKLIEERYPRFADMDVILYRHVRTLFENGVITDAAPLVEQLLARYPESEFKAIFRYYQARCQLDKGDFGDSYRILTMVVDRNDKMLDQTALNYYTAKSLSGIAMQGKWQPDAVSQINRLAQYIEKVLQVNPSFKEDAVALYKESCLNMTAVLYPGNSLEDMVARCKSAKSLQMRSQSQTLREITDEVVKTLAGDLVQTYIRLGDAAFKRNNFKVAQENYYQALITCPDCPEAAYLHYHNGLSLLRLRRAPNAAQAMRKAAYDYPDSEYAEDAHFQLGYILGSTMKQYVEGAREMETLAKRHANTETAPKALFYAGNYYQFAEDINRAKRQYAQLAKAYPSDKRAAWASELIQKIDEAEAARKERRIEARKSGITDMSLLEDMGGL